MLGPWPKGNRTLRVLQTYIINLALGVPPDPARTGDNWLFWSGQCKILKSQVVNDTIQPLWTEGASGIRANKCLENKDGRASDISATVAFEKTIVYKKAGKKLRRGMCTQHPSPLQRSLSYWWGAETRTLSRSLRQGPQENLVLGQKRGMSVGFGLARGQDTGRNVCLLIITLLLNQHHYLKERRAKGSTPTPVAALLQPPPYLTPVSTTYYQPSSPVAARF